MQNRKLTLVVVGFGFILSGCATSSPFKRPAPAGRTDAATATIVKPGTFGDNCSADRRRTFFDFWNEQVIREDVKVGTVFMGDSITELWNLDSYFVATDGTIQNRGISGDITTHMARRFEADVLQLHPRNLVILGGTNDVARMLDAKKSEEEIIKTVLDSFEKMMDGARAAKINVLVCSILATNDQHAKSHEGKKVIVPKINAKLKEMCVARGCIYVDYNAQMTDDKGDLKKTLANDGLHPHYAGYEIMARVLQTTAKEKSLKL